MISGVGLRGHWPDVIIFYIWFLATLALFIGFRKLKWVRIYARICMFLTGIFMLLGSFMIPLLLWYIFSLNFICEKDFTEKYSVQVSDYEQGPQAHIFKTNGPFETYLGTIHNTRYYGMPLERIKEAESMKVVARHGEDMEVEFEFTDMKIICLVERHGRAMSR
ncbi:hypothetical protein SAMN05428949_0899 [Chitinophaga sp. YR627]|nr:hypothetical protein SAMN05428949_0899 [Chitinophaga sp. YR627]